MQVACSHPERIVSLSQQIAAGAAVLEEQSAAARRAVASVSSVWHGTAASAFETTGAQLAAQLTRDSSMFGDIASALMELAATLEGAHELWHQAEAAQNVAPSSALVGMRAASPQAEALAGQAREQVTLAVQRAVLAFAVVTAGTWYFSGTALGGFVSDLEQEFTGARQGAAAYADSSLGLNQLAASAAEVQQMVGSLGRGRSPGVYIVPNAARLKRMFDRLASGGAPVSNSYPGQLVRLPDGTIVGMRSTSRSGGPTVDVWLPDGEYIKIHVQP